MRSALVLGGGGLVGLAYHAGVLRALEQEAGFDPAGADLVVGTSAGSVMGAYLRSGWSTGELFDLAVADVEPGAELPRALDRSFAGPVDLARRGLGAAWVLGRSALRLPGLPLPGLPLPGFLGHLFPGGLFAMTDGRQRLEAELGDAWPERDLWLTTYDLVRCRRVVLGAPGRTPPPLARAVRASCAIPGVYPPVPLGPLSLVDGGVWSPTNLDLAAECDLVVAVAPMAYDPADPPSGVARAAREVPARILRREAAAARRRGARVVLLRPSAAECHRQGLNLMAPDGLARVARDAYEATAWALASERTRGPLDRVAA